MSQTSVLSQDWKQPNELLKIQRLKQKQKALQARLNRPLNTQPNPIAIPVQDTYAEALKRKNPFAKQSDQISKKLRSEIDLTSDDTIFQLLQQSKIPSTANLAAPNHVVNNFSNILQQPPREIEYDDDPPEEEEILKPSATLPIDWSLKSRMRILSRTQIPGNNLKSNQEASGLTGFVRCLDIRNTSGGLDISPGARFHQCSMFWQYPHLPWLNLIQRNNKANNNFKMGEQESQSLLSDWSESFRNLFQLLRARQCPYFYVCANTFTALFRAAGIGGRSEMHVLLTPTTRGLRQLLKQKDIEFIQPLKQSLANKSGNSNTPNTSLTNSSDDATKDVEAEDNESDDEDMDDENWLKSLGVDQEDIKRINFTETRKEQKKECEDDFGDQSTALIEGVDCQAFFNFLLNAKTIVPKVGRLAGVPATLLAPSAFLGATLRKQTIRTSKVRVDGVDYCSMELKGVILPHTLHSLCQLLTEIKDSFSCTMASFNHTVAFTKVSQRIIEDSSKDTDKQDLISEVFGRENLSDCGLQGDIIESICRVSDDAVTIMERMCWNKEFGGYTWS